MSPLQSDMEAITGIRTPQPESKTDTEEALSPGLVTGQSKADKRGSKTLPASLEVPASPILRQISTCSTDTTDSEYYVTPRQSFNESIPEKKARTASKPVCKSCIRLRRSVSITQQEIGKLESELLKLKQLKESQVATLREELATLKDELLQKKMQCHNLGETCDDAVFFVQELEAMVDKLNSLLESKDVEKQKVWRQALANIALENLWKMMKKHFSNGTNEIGRQHSGQYKEAPRSNIAFVQGVSQTLAQNVPGPNTRHVIMQQQLMSELLIAKRNLYTGDSHPKKVHTIHNRNKQLAGNIAPGHDNTTFHKQKQDSVTLRAR